MARSKDNRHTKVIILMLLGAVPFAFLLLLIVKLFGNGAERSQASAVTTEVVAESESRTGEMGGRLFPVGSFLGLYNGEVYVCPAYAPEPEWGEEAGAVGVDWTWLEATEERPAVCKRRGPVGVSVIAAPGLLAVSGMPAAPAPAGSAARRAAAASSDSRPFDRDTAEVVVIGGTVGRYEGRTVTCVADSHAMRTLTADEWDFAHAADGRGPGACYRWHGGGVMPADWMKLPDKQDCLIIARANGMDAHIVERLKKVNPSELDDSERLDWREPAHADNGEKRNESYRSCITEWSGGASSLAFWPPMRLGEAERLLRKSYEDLSRHERETLRGFLDEGHGSAPYDCQLYYPQLYTGRWIPLE